ncbi:NAD(P)H-flavin reductase [Pseudidiomarina sp. GXY010]|uniref:NAD(P)H-flavin reductase n=1 Tax=Pseudidiomarina fusca TaxID=2965078 RepID=A0ABU3KYC3_9GAMM|nr:NAD(P)H-flavin reductase [Pseudidiomarina sp. GXY010]MDT7526503.1 NAD(P)H-flavin reductase [Pseudidiomarina sp. GXY010]
MQTMLCQVTAIEALTAAVYRVQLQPPQAMKFKAGQYLQVVMGERDKRPFSIASCPSDGSLLELHIGATPENKYAYEVLESMRNNGCIEIEGPLGDAWYRDDTRSTRPLILIAGGTGFSYAWSIAQAHLQRKSTRPVTLYWGVRSAADLYMHDQLQELAEAYPHFYYRPVVQYPEPTWTGLTGLVHQAVLTDQSDLGEADVYAAGRFEMVRIIRDEFHANGLPLVQLYGDALAFI